MLEQMNEALSKLYDKMLSWFDTIVLMLPNILISALVLGTTIFVARWMKVRVNKVMRKITHNPTVSSVASSVATAVIILVGLFIILRILGLDEFLTGLLASAGVVGLAVGLALQDPLINLFSGVIMSVRQLYNLGDLVETNGHFGNIQKISLRSTIIRAKDGAEIVIPNKDVIQNPLKNFTVSGDRRLSIECGVSYGDDLETVQEIAISAIKKSQIERDPSKDIELYYTSFGDSSINFMLRIWLEGTEQKSYLIAQSQAIIALKKAFDGNDIQIPFPIRTLDFGVKGGVNVQEAIPFQKFTVNRNSNQEIKNKQSAPLNGSSDKVTLTTSN